MIPTMCATDVINIWLIVRVVPVWAYVMHALIKNIYIRVLVMMSVPFLQTIVFLYFKIILIFYYLFFKKYIVYYNDGTENSGRVLFIN